MGFRATLNFPKFKVALNPMYRIFLIFAKSCVLSCLSNISNIKKFHRASGKNDTSKFTSWKVLETVLSHLKESVS